MLNLKPIFTRKPQSPDAIVDDLAAARAALDDAEAALASNQTEYLVALQDESPDAALRVRCGKIDLEVSVDRARIAVAALEARLRAVVDERDNAARLAKHAAATKARDAALARFGEYEQAGRTIASIISDIARADVLVAEANLDLPAGAEPIATVESRRVRPEMPRKVIGERTVKLFTYATNGDRAAVTDADVIETSPGMFCARWDPQLRFHRAKFLERSFIPATSMAWPEPLASVRIPSLMAGEPALCPTTGPAREPSIQLEFVRL